MIPMEARPSVLIGNPCVRIPAGRGVCPDGATGETVPIGPREFGTLPGSRSGPLSCPSCVSLASFGAFVVLETPGAVLADAPARHAASALGHMASGDYAGEHWLASFAVYLLTTRPAD